MTKRDDIVAAAVAELGSGNKVEYWRSALGREPAPDELHKAWCGIFALSRLHEAGVALDVLWHMGLGFLLQPPHPLKRTLSPLPGDIGYINAPFQHHLICEAVDGTLVHSIDGNQGTPGVQRKTRALSQVIFYSIEPYLAALELPRPSQPPPPEPSPFALQRAINAVILAHPLDHAPPLLRVDGIIGPKTLEARAWAESNHPGELHVGG